jgi:hypothetical protein
MSLLFRVKLVNVIVSNQENYHTNSDILCTNTGNKYHLRRPVARMGGNVLALEFLAVYSIVPQVL